MASWITQVFGCAQDLMASVARHCDLQHPTCIIAVGSVFVALFVVAKAWAYVSR